MDPKRRELLKKEFTERLLGDSDLARGLEKFKRLGEDDRKAALKTALKSQFEFWFHPLSLDSLRLKQAFLAEYGSKEVSSLLPASDDIMLTLDRQFQFNSGNSVYHYSAPGLLHEDQDTIVSIIENEGTAKRQFHAVFDGVTHQRGDGRVSSRRAADTFRLAAKLGIMNSAQDIVEVFEGINSDLWQDKAVTTGTAAMISKDSVVLVSLGDSPALLVEPSSHKLVFDRHGESENRFLGHANPMVKPTVEVMAPSPPRFVLLLASDGVDCLTREDDRFGGFAIPHAVELIQKKLSMNVPNFSDIPLVLVHLYGMSPDTPPKFCEHGHGDDASLILSYVDRKG